LVRDEAPVAGRLWERLEQRAAVAAGGGILKSAAPVTAALMLVAALVVEARGQSPAPPSQPPCSAPENRQFDFWIGSWNVENPKGQFVGTNEITSILSGCALEENWKGAKGLVGTSYNTYDPLTRKWHQTWIDSSGSLLLLDGGLVDGKMVLTGTQPDSSGGTLQHRITWTPIDSESVRQFWESSTDGGKTWTVAFDGLYRRRK
jgi:hypothetical protein